MEPLSRAAKFVPDPEVDAWFAQYGFRVQITRESHSLFWANLVSLRTGEVFAPKYGRGDSATDASLRARRRWEEEQ